MACCDVSTPVLPANATAGLTFAASVTLADYSTADWTLTAALRGPAAIDLEADADGLTTFKFGATAAVTAEWAPGVYWYTVRVTDGTDVIEVSKGQLEVLPDLAAVTDPFDGRSESEIALDAIKAVLAKRASIDQERYVINNRELWRTPIADLLKLRAFYASQVQRERACREGRSTLGRRVGVRF